MNDMKDLKGKSILVVGASSGLGRAIAEAVARRGASLTLAARRRDRLEDLAAKLDTPVATVDCDVTRAGDPARAVEAAVSEFGGLDVLVYSAGYSPLGAIVDTTSDEWHRIFSVNAAGAALTAAAAVPHLRQNSGRAFFMSSAAAKELKDGLVPYASSKQALEGIVEGLRLEEPGVAFTTIVVASTGQTEFTSAWDPDVHARYIAHWQRKGLLTRGSFAEEATFADVVVALMSAGIGVPQIFLGPLPFDGALPEDSAAPNPSERS
jgi:NAD(P)-dependent dehydrogenase (short-subunit alcohol dehydrogenase family)